MCRTDALNVGLLHEKDEILLRLQTESSALQMVNSTDVHKASGRLPVGLAHFGDSSNTPWLHELSCSPN